MTEKVMLITGASSGIGEATARAAAAKGYRLVLTARRAERLDQLVEQLGAEQTLAVSANATLIQEQARVVDAAIERFGRLDVAFANAGTGISQPGTEKGDPDEWQRVIDINVMALLWTAKLTLPHLRKTQGHFVLTSSVAGRTSHKGSIYGASKWFAYGFGINLAEEMAEWGGRCTTICPGMTDTAFFDNPKPDKLMPEDIADSVLFALEAPKRANVREVFVMPTH